MKRILLLVGIFFTTACAQDTAVRCDVNPAIFCQPFENLSTALSPLVKQQLLALPNSQYAKLHMGLGLEVRNRAVLWENNDITRYFRAHGVDHPDYMALPFIAGFVDYLQGKHVDMAKEIELWGPKAPPPPPPEPPGYAPHAIGLTSQRIRGRDKGTGAIK